MEAVSNGRQEPAHWVPQKWQGYASGPQVGDLLSTCTMQITRSAYLALDPPAGTHNEPRNRGSDPARYLVDGK